MTEERISVQIGPHPTPPVVADLWSYVHHQITVYIEGCEYGCVNPSVHGFGMFLLEQSNFYDTTSTF